MNPQLLRIIVVDDDPYNRETIQEVLEGAGHTVRATALGSEAVRWLQEGACDLLVMDLNMPEMDGPALYRAVKERWGSHGPRALFVSGYADLGPYGTDPDVQHVPTLFKPFSLVELHASVEQAMTAEAAA